jgi:hypothetical protein
MVAEVVATVCLLWAGLVILVSSIGYLQLYVAAHLEVLCSTDICPDVNIILLAMRVLRMNRYKLLMLPSSALSKDSILACTTASSQRLDRHILPNV